MPTMLWKKKRKQTQETPNLLAKETNSEYCQPKNVNILVKLSDAGTWNLKPQCLVLQFMAIFYFPLQKHLLWNSYLANPDS